MTTHDLAFGWKSVSWHRLGSECGVANSESCADHGKNNDSGPGERRGRDSRDGSAGYHGEM